MHNARTLRARKFILFDSRPLICEIIRFSRQVLKTRAHSFFRSHINSKLAEWRCYVHRLKTLSEIDCNRVMFTLVRCTLSPMFQVCILQTEVRCPQTGNVIFIDLFTFNSSVVLQKYSDWISVPSWYISTVSSSYLVINKKTVRCTFYEPPIKRWTKRV